MGGSGKLKNEESRTIQNQIDNQRGQSLTLAPQQLPAQIAQAHADPNAHKITISHLVGADPSRWGFHAENLFPNRPQPAQDLAANTNRLLLGTLQAASAAGITTVTDAALRTIVSGLQSGTNAPLLRSSNGTLISATANSRLYRIHQPSLHRSIQRTT